MTAEAPPQPRPRLPALERLATAGAMVVPTRRALALAAALVLMAFVIVTAAPALWPLMMAALALLLLALGLDALGAVAERDLGVTVIAPPLIFMGDPDPLQITVSPQVPRPVELTLLLDVVGDVAPFVEQRLRALAGHDTELRLPMRPYRRGTARLTHLWLRWSGPLGLMARIARRPLDLDIAIVPNLRALTQGALSLTLRELMNGNRRQRELGEGTEFDALREYAPGRDIRTIDWKHSARHRQLVCKEYVHERNHSVILAFDCGYLMREHLERVPRLDHAINAGLALAWLCLHQGDLVGLYAFDSRPRQWLAPLRGRHAFSAFQQMSAALAYRTEEANHTLGLSQLSGRLTRRSLVVLFTEFIDTTTAQLMVEDLESLARRHVVIFVTLSDPQLLRAANGVPATVERLNQAVLAHEAVAERAAVLRRLRRSGIVTLDTPPGTLSVGLLNTYLQIKQRNLI